MHNCKDVCEDSYESYKELFLCIRHCTPRIPPKFSKKNENIPKLPPTIPQIQASINQK